MRSISPYGLLGVSIVISTVFTALRNLFSKTYAAGKADYFGFNALSSAFSLAFFIMSAGGWKQGSAYTLWMGLCFGLATTAATVFYLQALSIGPLSYTTVIVSASTIMTALSGAVVWGESVNAWQISGLVTLGLSLLCSVEKGEARQSSMKWLSLSLLAFLFSGTVGIMQKMHQASVHRAEIDAFLQVAFLTSGLCSVLIYSVSKKTRMAAGNPNRAARVVGLAAASGITFAFANRANLYLSGVISSIIFFPLVNGGVIVLSTIVGILCFKERLSARQWLGMALGVLSLLLIGGVFGFIAG